MILPLLIGVSISSVLGALSLRVVHYYGPIIILGAVWCPTGVPLLTPLTANTTSGPLIGYQTICSFGVGLMMQEHTHLT